jgi:glycosyl transferase, family 25
MADLVEFFDAAYLINLPERADRRQAAIDALGQIGARVGPGAPGAVEIYPAVKPAERCGFPSAAVRGCFLSHLDCLTRAQRNGCRHVLVMEDDITFSPALPRLTPTLTAWLSAADWDLIYFGHYNTGDIGYADSKADSVDLITAPDNIRGAHFYCVSGSILPKLLQHLERIRTGPEGDREFGPMSIDGAYNSFRRVNPGVRVFIAAPQLGWQRFSPSNITPRKIDSVPWLRFVMRSYRSLKNFAVRRRL